METEEERARGSTLSSERLGAAPSRSSSRFSRLFTVLRAGASELTIPVRDVRAALQVESRYPFVCSALGSKKLEELCGIEQITGTGPSPTSPRLLTRPERDSGTKAYRVPLAAVRDSPPLLCVARRRRS